MMRMLFVDDEERMVQEILEGFRFRGMEFTCDVATHLQQAFDLTKANMYDVVITDWMFPANDYGIRTSGERLLDDMLSTSKFDATKIFILTAVESVNINLKRYYWKHNFVRYIMKPVRPSELFDIIMSS